MIKKFIFILTFLLLNCHFVSANEIDKFIKQSDFELKSVVSVFAKDTKTGAVVYEKNSKKLLNPASMLKVLTFGVSNKILGDDYKFETALYKDSKNNIYMKLGADPLLTQGDLNELFYQLKTKFDTTKLAYIYIDDSIIDKIPYPEGWMQDDMWPYQRLLSPYIVDKNITDVAIKRSSLSTRVDIIQNDDYKLPIINELKLVEKETGKQEIKIVRQYGEDLPIVNFKGTVIKDEILKLPVLNPELNFKIKTQNAITKNDITYRKRLFNKKLPIDAVKVASVSHNLDEVAVEVLHNSNNFAAETVFKVAAAKYVNYRRSASTEDGIMMFNNYYKDILNDDIKIVDASGVSRYNLVDSEFIVDALFKLSAETNVKEKFATSGVGTLKDRLLFLKDNLKAKTGTLSKMSSICGFLTTAKDNDLAFAIIVQNSPKRKAILKNFEDNLITILYRKF